MTLLRESIVVNRSIEDCFRYVSDFSTVEQWDPGVFRSEKITPGEVRVGTAFDVLLNVAGRESAMQYVVRDLQPNARVVLEGENSTLKGLDTITFTELDAGTTKIIYEADLQFKGPVALVAPLMGPVLNRIGKAAVDGLQQALTIGDARVVAPLSTKISDRLVLPAARAFTKQGYYAMPDKSHAEFMDGKTVVITGPTSGLGLAAACEFSRLGANLVLVGRNKAKLASAAEEIRAFGSGPGADIKTVVADLALVAEAKRAAKAIQKAAPRLDVLVNNAGALFNDREVTSEGNEQSLAINLLAPYVLVEALAPHLEQCATHVINVVSGGMYLQSVNTRDMQFERGSYDGAKAYARAKRALVALTEHWSARFRRSGVRVNSMHPGWAQTPGVANSLPSFNKRLAGRLRDSRMGADTIVWLASAKAAQTETGKFWFDRLPRTTEVIPGTGVSGRQLEVILAYLSEATGVPRRSKKPRAPRLSPARAA